MVLTMFAVSSSLRFSFKLFIQKPICYVLRLLRTYPNSNKQICKEFDSLLFCMVYFSSLPKQAKDCGTHIHFDFLPFSQIWLQKFLFLLCYLFYVLFLFPEPIPVLKNHLPKKWLMICRYFMWKWKEICLEIDFYTFRTLFF